jgi:hypothetical protein
MVMNSGFHKKDTFAIRHKVLKTRSLCQAGSSVYSLKQPVHVETNRLLKECHPVARRGGESGGGGGGLRCLFNLFASAAPGNLLAW